MKRHIAFLILAVAVLQSAWAAGKQPAFVMIGDGTMANQTDVETSDIRGWGQMFSAYVADMEVVNAAQPGMCVRTLTANAGALDSLLMPYGKKDILFIQFGQNDLHENQPAQYSPVNVLIQRLMVIIHAAQAKKMRVILCTPLAEPFWSNGQWVDRLGAYPQAIRNVAKSMQLPLVDMEAVSRQWLIQMGEENAKTYYVDLVADQSPEGEYLLNEAGASAISRMAAQELKSLNLRYLSKSIVITDDANRQ